MKATYVRDLEGFSGTAKLYRVEPAVELDEGEGTTDHVVVSKVCGWAHETYIFAANEKGEVIDWTERDGSSKGEHSHEEVLGYAGYEVA